MRRSLYVQRPDFGWMSTLELEASKREAIECLKSLELQSGMIQRDENATMREVREAQDINQKALRALATLK